MLNMLTHPLHKSSSPILPLHRQGSGPINPVTIRKPRIPIDAAGAYPSPLSDPRPKPTRPTRTRRSFTPVAGPSRLRIEDVPSSSPSRSRLPAFEPEPEVSFRPVAFRTLYVLILISMQMDDDEDNDPHPPSPTALIRTNSQTQVRLAFHLHYASDFAHP